MSELTLNSNIGDLLLAMGDVIGQSNGNATTFYLEIPDQSFYLEITIKSKEVADDTEV